jgi:hypothetical protein
MSSHREAPEISKDPVADSTDTYAFMSPNRPGFVSIITNYIPLQNPAGGPNFFEFGDDVDYQINIDNNGDGRADIVYDFRFTTTIRNPNTFLYNTGTIDSLTSPNFNRPQTYTMTTWRRHHEHEHDHDDGLRQTNTVANVPVPPCNIGPLSTPNYGALAASAVTTLGDGTRLFAGQRLDGFYVDLGAVFDLADLRPFQQLHVASIGGAQPGVDGLRAYNVHSIAIEVPVQQLTRDGSRPTHYRNPHSTIGVWASASRQKALVRNPDGPDWASGPMVQVSRLGNPLVNEALIPMSEKDTWNSLSPSKDKQFATYVDHPELAGLLPALYPGVFPHLAAYNKPRADLDAILLTGIPDGIVPGFQNFTGSTKADELRLNVAIPPASSPSNLGILGGDLAGFPNGRRPADDVFTIELQAIAGATLPLVDPTFTPDGAATAVTDGVTPPGNVSYLDHFPWLDDPKSGYDVIPPA